jgi:hypothetical protein
MSCAKTTSSRYVIPHPISLRIGWSPLLTVIVALIDAVREAQEMQWAAHRKRPFLDE